MGFPHRGFPKEVEQAILKGASKLTIRAGLSIPPVDFEKNIKDLSEKFKIPITPEQGMSYLMYPKVFSDYLKRIESKGQLLRYLPTTVYFYAMEAGQTFTMTIPQSLSKELLLPSSSAISSSSNDDDATMSVKIELKRVGPLANKMRQVVFTVNGTTQIVNVKDTSGAFVFEGLMADTSVLGQMASPMPGITLDFIFIVIFFLFSFFYIYILSSSQIILYHTHKYSH